MPIYKVCCEKCGYQAWSSKLWGPKSYIDSNGKDIPVNVSFSWCNECQSFEPVESFHNTLDYVHKLNESIENIKTDTNSIIKLFFIRLMSRTRVTDKYFVNEAERYVRKIEQDLKRKGTEKCITCGSEDVVLYSGDKSIGWQLVTKREDENVFINIQHPNCGGSLYITHDSLRIMMTFDERMFSLDGKEIKGN